jgi:alginate O-acetyltransferase complex protein AlgJ
MVTGREPELTREEVAQREIALTAMSRATARFLLGVFLVLIAAVPLLEVFRSARGAATASWVELRGLPAEITSNVATVRFGGGGPWSQIVAANRAVRDACRRFEDALEDASVIGTAARPSVQLALTSWLGAGNEGVLTGRAGWLFYARDVHYVTGGGFLEPRVLERRGRTATLAGAPIEPDPRKAILAFSRELAARGISLIVVPTPLKPTIHPEKLSRRYDGNGEQPQNPSFASFVAGLRNNGVAVFDPAEALAENAARSHAPQYLATDTHWRPEAMQWIAQRLADYVRTRVPLPEMAPVKYATESRTVRKLGDVALMLDLPGTQTRYAPEAVTVRRILSADGNLWRPSPAADVLLLGDSFSNIYAVPSLGWGEGAGFAEQLSYELQRPLDRITQNDEGANATRLSLRRAGPDRLATTRVVIYQFAARELAFGDWPLIPLPQ